MTAVTVAAVSQPVAWAQVETVDATEVSGEIVWGDGEDAEVPGRYEAPKGEEPETYLPVPLPKSTDDEDVNQPRSANPDEFVVIDVETREAVVMQSPAELRSLLEGDSVAGGLGAFLGAGEEPTDGLSPNNFSNLSFIGDTTTGRRPTAVKLFMNVRDTGGTLRGYVCSGTLIDPKHVLTAGHCIYFHTDDDNGWVFNDWAESITVVPAYDNGVEPFGRATSQMLGSFTGWTGDENFDHDVGLIELDRPVGALTGWRAYGYYNNCSDFKSGTWEHFGYPAASPYNGQFMYTNSGDFDSCEVILGVWTGGEVRFTHQG